MLTWLDEGLGADYARHVIRHTLEPSFLELKLHMLTWRAQSSRVAPYLHLAVLALPVGYLRVCEESRPLIEPHGVGVQVDI